MHRDSYADGRIHAEISLRSLRWIKCHLCRNDSILWRVLWLPCFAKLLEEPQPSSKRTSTALQHQQQRLATASSRRTSTAMQHQQQQLATSSSRRTSTALQQADLNSSSCGLKQQLATASSRRTSTAAAAAAAAAAARDRTPPRTPRRCALWSWLDRHDLINRALKLILGVCCGEMLGDDLLGPL